MSQPRGVAHAEPRPRRPVAGDALTGRGGRAGGALAGLRRRPWGNRRGRRWHHQPPWLKSSVAGGADVRGHLVRSLTALPSRACSHLPGATPDPI